ncbi:MAG: hypothetical protein V4484_21225 [Pseudomonadota bacterium]
MVENLIVVLIVGASAWHIGARYLRPKPKTGCATGCDTCNGCATPAAESTPRRVIKIHTA